MEKPVNTRHGPFDRQRLARLKETLEGESDDTSVMFEGWEMSVAHGQFLVSHVEQEFAKRNTRGL